MSSSRSWRNEFTNLGKAYFAYTSSPSPQADQKEAVYEVILGFVFNAGKKVQPQSQLAVVMHESWTISKTNKAGGGA